MQCAPSNDVLVVNAQRLTLLITQFPRIFLNLLIKFSIFSSACHQKSANELFLWYCVSVVGNGRKNKEYEVFSSPVLHHTEIEIFLNLIIKFSTFYSLHDKNLVIFALEERLWKWRQKQKKKFSSLFLSPAVQHTAPQNFSKLVHKIQHILFSIL